jgi:hypothetical protein
VAPEDSNRHPPPNTAEILSSARIDLTTLNPSDRDDLLALTPDQAALLVAILAERTSPGPLPE